MTEKTKKTTKKVEEQPVQEFYKIPKNVVNATVQLLMKINNVEVSQVLQIANALQKSEIIQEPLKKEN